MIKRSSKNWVLALILITGLTGCAEVRKLVSLFSKKGSIALGSARQIEELSSGIDFTCALLGNRQLRCVGSGEKGNLGTYYNTIVPNLKDIKQVAAGNGFTCTISGETSAVHCFGQNDKGQLGNPAGSASVTPVPVIDLDNNNAELADAVMITAGEQHACAVLKNGRGVCWGSNSSGQLGNQSQDEMGAHSILDQERTSKPFTGIQSIAAGGNSTCMIAKSEQFVFCFGSRYQDASPNPWIPRKMELFANNVTLTQAKQVVMGEAFGCALIRSQVFCWGMNDAKQLGNKTAEIGNSKAVPVEVSYPTRSVLSKIEMLAAGDKHACGLHRDEGTIFCWGNNSFGQLGTTSTHGAPEQVAVTSSNLTLKRAKAVYAGKERTCTVASTDELFCWGNGAQGVLGSEATSTSFPLKVLNAEGNTVTILGAFSIGNDHACGVDGQNKLFCFGINTHGQMGAESVAGPVLSFTGRNPIDQILTLDSYGHRTCMIYGPNRAIACFGGKPPTSVNYRINQNNFTLEEVLTYDSKNYQDVIAITDGLLNLCLIHPNQTVECIDFKTRPPNHFFAESSPKNKVPDLWMVKTNGNLYCGLTREKGEIWCWGQWKNVNLTQAQQIKMNGEAAKNFVQFVVNEDQICGVSGSSGSVFCSPITDGQFSMSLQPQLDMNGAALTGVYSLTNGKNHVCGISNKSQILCWGSNEYGQLGTKAIKHITDKAVPVEMSPELVKMVSKISAGDLHTCFSTLFEPVIRCFGKSFYNNEAIYKPKEYSL
jgi:alpha-tubulin suppressor-like RCC1 family protein